MGTPSSSTSDFHVQAIFCSNPKFLLVPLKSSNIRGAVLLKGGGQSLVCSSYPTPTGCPGVRVFPRNTLWWAQRGDRRAQSHTVSTVQQRLGPDFLAAGSVFPAKTSSPLPITPQVGYVGKYEIWIECMGVNLTSPFPRRTILEIFLNLSVCLCSFLPLCLAFFQHIVTVNLLYARCLVESGLLDVTWIQLCCSQYHPYPWSRAHSLLGGTNKQLPNVW